MELIGYCRDLYEIECRKASTVLDLEAWFNEHFPNASLYEKFKKYEVLAESIENFIARYGKPSSYSERGEEYMSAVYKSHLLDLEEFGYDFITHHDSKTGECVSYYGRSKID